MAHFDDNQKDYNQGPADDSSFLEQVKLLYLEDPEEAIARLEDRGYTVNDLDLDV